MDSDQDQDSADDWVVLGSSASTSSSDDDRGVIALSSGCATPASDRTDPDLDDLLAEAAGNLLLAAAADDDVEGLYALSDAEDHDHDHDNASPQPKPLSGLFDHTLDGAVNYVPFAPARHRAAKQLVPDPTFAAFFSEPVAVLASTRGLVCLRGVVSGDYYVANPLTFQRAPLPPHACAHHTHGDPAVVITFEEPDAEDDDDASCHYHVAVAFPVIGGGDDGDDYSGVYAFESFSSRTWAWTAGTGIAPAETVVHASGVGALGCAFWRATMGYFICYNPATGCTDLLPAPQVVSQWPHWELGEMEGTLCATCMDDRVDAVIVVCRDLARLLSDDGHVAWTLVGHFEGGCLRGREGVTLLRSQGKAEVVMWDPRAEMVVAMDLEGRTTRTIGPLFGLTYYADFIPYVSSLAGISGPGSVAVADCRTIATNEAGAQSRKLAASAY